MSLSDLSLVDSAADLPPAAASRLEDAQSSAHTGIALLMGTVVASPVLVAALLGRGDVAVALALYVAALVGSWIAVGLFAGAFALAGRSRRRAEETPAAATPRTAPTDVDADDADDEAVAGDPDHATSTR